MHNSVSILTKEKYNSASILLESMRSIAPHVAWCARLGNNGLLRTRSVPTGLYMLPYYILLLGSQTFSFTFSVVMNTVFILIMYEYAEGYTKARQLLFSTCMNGEAISKISFWCDVCILYRPIRSWSTVHAVHSSCTVQYSICSTLLMYSTV